MYSVLLQVTKIHNRNVEFPLVKINTRKKRRKIFLKNK